MSYQWKKDKLQDTSAKTFSRKVGNHHHFFSQMLNTILFPHVQDQWHQTTNDDDKSNDKVSRDLILGEETGNMWFMHSIIVFLMYWEEH